MPVATDEPGGGAVVVWRLVKARWAATAFDGEGARRGGGRWNSPGVPVVYLAGTLELAQLEVLVNLPTPRLLGSYVAFRVSVPSGLVEAVAPRELPADWRRDPAPRSAQAVGDAWVRAERSAVLRVPSAVVPSSPNYLVNPAHPDARRLVVDGPFDPALDPRLQ
ncbi:RES family NAD+ phosphorylase [Rubrivirga litoralis]|uniref:RES family NAD+ phosphorylase n=1 Tax=Rubrivirga litoralis TaxID=3075598 RepID=A0ABU3BUG8_9BACT|nr:RES family NAD+ phosphorylase [Rubrivirga sp. F394]MDT0632937.1 RES family NAD+ phosphorylase [Rubrivirga sp. F394]